MQRQARGVHAAAPQQPADVHAVPAQPAPVRPHPAPAPAAPPSRSGPAARAAASLASWSRLAGAAARSMRRHLPRMGKTGVMPAQSLVSGSMCGCCAAVICAVHGSPSKCSGPYVCSAGVLTLHSCTTSQPAASGATCCLLRSRRARQAPEAAALGAQKGAGGGGGGGGRWCGQGRAALLPLPSLLWLRGLFAGVPLRQGPGAAAAGPGAAYLPTPWACLPAALRRSFAAPADTPLLRTRPQTTSGARARSGSSSSAARLGGRWSGAAARRRRRRRGGGARRGARPRSARRRGTAVSVGGRRWRLGHAAARGMPAHRPRRLRPGSGSLLCLGSLPGMLPAGVSVHRLPPPCPLPLVPLGCLFCRRGGI